MTRTSDLKEFVHMYKTAVRSRWSYANLADYCKLSPETIKRKARKARATFMSKLPPLAYDAPALTPAAIERFKRDIAAQKKPTSKLSGKKKPASAPTESAKTSAVFLITAAQNATPVHQKFLRSCLTFCKHRNAELIVVPYRYKNPSSVWSSGDAGHEWWDSDILPYIRAERFELCKNLVVLGNIKIVPTALDPLSGFEGFSGMDSNILAHPKVRFRSVPTLNGNPKILLSTGAITVPNYTDSKAGHTASYHHSIAAVVVEVDADGVYHVRHVHAATNGEFYDLNTRYSPSGITTGHRIEALVAGDIHAEFMDQKVNDATFGTGKHSMVNVLDPKLIVLHDVTDFYARNHHHKGKDILAYGKLKYGRNNVRDGLQQAADFIDSVSRKRSTVVIVKSNHDEAFDRWLAEADIKNDPENMDLFYYMKYHQMKSIRFSDTGFESFDPFKFWCMHPESGRGLRSAKRTRFLRRDESLKVCGSVEIGFHGDVGINGARGDIKSLAKLSDKMVIGHSHSPGIYEGCYQVGLSSRKNLEYKSGPSSWMQTHCIIYPDGKRTLINIVHGRWKGESS